MQKQSKELGQEISRTRKAIGENEQQIREGMSRLESIRADIAGSQQLIATSAAEVGTLNGKISSLQTSIAAGEKKLERLRATYLKSLKKMRAARGRNAKMAFVFASKSFSESLRRMRYLREFGRWRSKKSAEIQAQIDLLKDQHRQLDEARSDKNKALARQKQAQSALTAQQKQQDALVAQLRVHGDELRAHLAAKQQEANQLNARISSLIAEEQRKAAEKAAAEKAAREKAAREKAAREKAAAEKAAREKAAAEKAAAEKAAREKAAAEKAAAEKAAREKAAADKAAKEKKKQEEKKKQADEKKKQADEKKKQEQAKQSATDKVEERRDASKGGDYAKARGRQPRTSTEQPSAPKTETPSTPSAPSSSSSGAAFENMRGSLPHPVSGSFKIVRPFGRHSLPDLPEVTFDNPGIDVEVSAGASAQAVFPGKVSGIYVLPGYETVIIVSHGNYYTVYGNISQAAVKNGDSVSTGQRLGSLAQDPENPKRTLIHFELWHGREKLNPASWLK